MNLKRTLSLILSILFLLTLTACSDIDSEAEVVTEDVVINEAPVKAAYPVSFGTETFDSAPETVASLSPALTEIMYELGLSEKLVAVSEYCDNYNSLPTVGSPANPDIDAIIELAPELLITQSPIASTDEVKLDQAGVRVLYLELPTGFSYLCEEYIELSMIFYGAVDSEEVALAALSEIDDIMLSAQNLGVSENFVIIYYGLDGGFTASAGNDIASDMLSVFGTNLLETEDEELAIVSYEELEEMNLGVIFADEALSDEDLEDLDAEIIYLDLSKFSKPTAQLSGIISECIAELS
ncbi:MAG: ABC transporter substrate-binding protein [Oscillospiraceae bacterium]|nr:ABC transporter substrate-binding protein [Oscillospiraceae bacterium]